MFKIHKLIQIIIAVHLITSCEKDSTNINHDFSPIKGDVSDYVTIEKFEIIRKKYCLLKLRTSEEFFMSQNCNISELVAIDKDKNQRLLDYYQHENKIFLTFHFGDYEKPTSEQRKVSLVEFNTESNTTKKIATNINIQEFDTIYHSARYKDGALVCATNRCFKINENNQELIELTPLNERNQFITEMIISDDQIVAILKNPKADSFSLASYNNNSLEFSKFHNDCLIPFNLQLSNEKASFKCISQEANQEYIELLNNELKKLVKIQKRNKSVTNNDGRIVWEQSDYLPGVVKILANEHVFNKIESSVRNETEKLTSEEVNNLLKLSENHDFLKSKRYSISGTGEYFAIHNFTYLKLIHELSIENKIPDKTAEFLGSFNSTIEELKYMNFSDEFIPVVFFKKNSSFWADGINTPYNFSSSIALGLLYRNKNTSDIQLAENLLKPLLKNEFPIQHLGWHYWWGIGKRGWQESDTYSKNTKSYSGNDSIANISYLSIDAEAILKLSQHKKSPEINLAINNIEKLISECYLPSYLMPKIKIKCKRTDFVISHASEFKEFFYLVSYNL